jgi:signal transduction histidine kinase
MTLRTKLALSLLAAALLPMGVAVGVPLLQAGERARRETGDRLAQARRQAALLVSGHRDETAARVARAAADLELDRDARRFLRQGTEAAGTSVARSLAGRHGLDRIAIRDRSGNLLAGWPVGTGGALPGEGDETVILLQLPRQPAGLDGEAATGLFHLAVHPVRSNDEILLVTGAALLGETLIRELSEVAGEPVRLLDPEAAIVAAAGDPRPPGRRVDADLPLGDGGWRIRIAVPEGSAWRIRRELLTSLAGVAPFAVISALIVGALLAQGISRPIRSLVARVDALTTEHATTPLTVGQTDDEVRRLTLSFDRMLEALAESERQRGSAEKIAAWQEVARRIAHEVKNPLSPIRLAVENLKRTRARSPDDFDRALEEETATIIEEVDSLRRLVDEFSDFARLPGPRPAPCDLRAVIAQVLSLFAPRLESEAVRVTLDDGGSPPSMVADAEQIGRVLKNVVSNALDAMAGVADRQLQIAVRRVEGRRRGGPAGFVEVEVRDNGAGFSPDALRRVFEPYFTTRSGRGGTGLGMAIAYRIVADHGGTMRALEAPRGGATISMRLPVDGPPAG